MKRWTGALIVATAALLLRPDAAGAANKEQQLLMAEIRMMQQHQQQLQLAISTLADTLKAFNGRLDEQAATGRKALADQRLLIEGMTDTVRVLRERSDDTNVRLSSIAQELESIRQTMTQAQAQAQAALAAPPVDPTVDPSAAAAPAPAAPLEPAPAAPPGISAQRTYDSAFGDYAAGHYKIAIEGFETFLKFFPRHINADDAQLNIGNSLYNAGQYREAVVAYQRVISDYPKTNSVPQAYYKLGLSYIGLKEPALARKALETVTQEYPESPVSPMAKQALDRLGRGEP
jgi:tol-pal system protein YbgF